jgi:hypothetical protein
MPHNLVRNPVNRTSEVVRYPEPARRAPQTPPRKKWQLTLLAAPAGQKPLRSDSRWCTHHRSGEHCDCHPRKDRR